MFYVLYIPFLKLDRRVISATEIRIMFAKTLAMLDILVKYSIIDTTFRSQSGY